MRQVLRVARYRFRATIGQRWAGYLGLVILLGLMGGVAMGAVSAGRRTRASFPAFLNVNAIAPTVFRSELTGWMYADSGNGPAVRENMLRRIPLGRLGEPTDFHGAVVCLASSASDFMTGSIVYLDGGYTAG